MTTDEFFAQQEEAARRIAYIVGVTSAARAALENMEKRRALGEDAVIWRDGKKWVVGPRQAAASAFALEVSP
jgi:hypothetical protein